MIKLLVVLMSITIISFCIMVYLIVSDIIYTKKRDEYKKELENRVGQSLFIYMEESIKHDTPIDNSVIDDLKDAGKRMIDAEIFMYDEKQRRLHY